MKGFPYITDADVTTFLKLKTSREMRQLVDKIIYFHGLNTSLVLIYLAEEAIGRLLPEDLPLYLNHPSDRFRGMVQDRLKGGF